MSSRFPERRAALLALAICTGSAAAEGAAAPGSTPDGATLAAGVLPLRICADPDNLPYSHRLESGFENRIAQVVASDLGRPLQYYWQPQQRGFVRKTLGEGHCDLFIGVPVDFDLVLTTRPYYRSSYVFAFRADEPAPLKSFDDPRLQALRVGVQLVGDDLAATPPGHALARAGAVDRVVGYPVMGDGPAASRMLDALANRRLDAALVWGPQAGWYLQRSSVPLKASVATAPRGLATPFEFAVAMGVKRGNGELRDALDASIARRRTQIDAILREYAVPRTDVEEAH